MAVEEVINWENVNTDNPAPIPPGPDGNRPRRIGLAMQEMMGSIARWRDTLSGSTGTLLLSANEPFLAWNEEDATANNRRWDIRPISEQLRFRLVNDDDNSFVNWMTVDRTLNTVDLIALSATQINLGNYDFDVDQTVGAGQDNYYLKYDNAGGLISLEALSVDLASADVTGDLPFSNIQQINTNRFLGRDTAGTGDIEELTQAAATALLQTFTTSLQGVVPGSGGGTSNFLRADGSWATPSGTGIGGTIADDQIAVGAATADEIEGSSSLTWDATDLSISSTGPTTIEMSGDGSGFINAGLRFTANNLTDTRGLGVFMYDSGGDNEWFMGRPYATSDNFHILRATGKLGPNDSTADDADANTTLLFSLGNTGVATFFDNVYIQPLDFLYFDGGGDTGITESSANNLAIYTGGTVGFQVNASQNILLGDGTAKNVSITQTTLDAADTGAIWIAGGGGVSQDRGAKILLYGNEATTFGSNAYLDAGATGDIILRTGASLTNTLTLNAAGSLTLSTGTFTLASAQRVQFGDGNTYISGNAGSDTLSMVPGATERFTLTDTSARLVDIPLTSGEASTNGMVALQGYYTANDNLLVVGSLRSSGNTVLCKAVRPDNVTSSGFESSAGNSAFARGALEVGGNEFTMWGAASATVAVGTDVTMTELAYFGSATARLGNYEFDVNQTVGASQDNYVLTYDDTSGLISLEAAAGGGIGGTIADDQIAVGAATANEIEGSSTFALVSSSLRIPGGIRLTERADHIETPAATFGEVWLEDGTQQHLKFTDDGGIDHILHFTEETEGSFTLANTVDFTGLPAGITWIRIMVDEFAPATATQDLILRLGAGSVATTGYNTYRDTNGTRTADTTQWVLFDVNASTNEWSGTIELTRVDPSDDVWTANGTFHEQVEGTLYRSFCWGTCNLTGTLDRVRIQTAGATNATSGRVNITYG